MLRYMATAAVLGLSVSPAAAWNEKGHMVVARLAWNELTAQERAKVIKILESHEHYGELLKKDRPPNIPEDEWVFMRAAVWADLVRSAKYKKFHEPNWHFINHPFVVPGSAAESKEPKAENVVAAINMNKQQATGGGDQKKRAIAVTWLFHLIGDVHQPLHCATLFSDEFPNGDRGGTRARFRINDGTAQLHAFWDGLLGRSISLSSIGSSVHEVEALLKVFPDAVGSDLTANTTPAQWAKEGFDLAVKFGYLGGELDVAHADTDPTEASLQPTPDGYAETAGQVARFAAAKAGKRLAKVLKEVLAEN